MAERADKLLFEQNIFESRKKAQVAIGKGLVAYSRQGKIIPVSKTSQIIEWQDGDSWQITDDIEFQFVSRAGAKLAAALDHWQLPVKDFVVLDVGLSTGGFSDCLLQRGAKWILGIDVGQRQLHVRLHNHPQLFSIEKFNGKIPLEESHLDLVEQATQQRQFDLLVFDVSFISVDSLVQAQWPHLRPGGKALVLFKPQFEAGRAALDKKGVVSAEEGLRVLQKTVKTWNSAGYPIVDTFQCPLKGEDGNQEFFILMQK